MKTIRIQSNGLMYTSNEEKHTMGHTKGISGLLVAPVVTFFLFSRYKVEVVSSIIQLSLVKIQRQCIDHFISVVMKYVASLFKFILLLHLNYKKYYRKR